MSERRPPNIINFPDHIRVTHDIGERGKSNLFFLLNALNGALNKFAEEIGDGLHAVALALSTKEDNSAQILELANSVKSVREKLKTSVDKQTKGE